MKKFKHLKTFEGMSGAEDEGLYDDMSGLLTKASELYEKFSGEEYDFDPDDAMKSLSEITEIDNLFYDAQKLIDEIGSIQTSIDEMDSEEYFEEDEDY
jgi:hypothetical protein